jgi:CelD/BcsL family acetyltransferase involved in cellulose biosynthesis
VGTALSPPLRVETISGEAAFARLGGDWDELVRSMPRPTPFLLHGWLLEWWRHYGENRTLAVHVATRGGRLVGAIPLCRSRRLGLRVTEFVGGTKVPLADLLVAPDEEAATATLLAERIKSSGDDFADLFGMPAGSRLAAAVPAGSLHLLERLEAPVLDLRPGWDEIYRQRLSPKARSERRRRRRQLEELGTVEVSIERTPEELRAPLEDAFRLHALRWEGRREASGLGTTVGRAFHRAALRRLAGQDVPRLLTLRLNEQAIAYSIYLVLERTMFGLSMAFDPAFARYSPGTEALLASLESGAGEGAERVEFLGAATPYKRRFTDRLEPIHEAIGLPSTLRGRVALGALVGGIKARRRLKRWKTARRLYDRVPRLVRG